jgi:hypothetical protein
MTNTNSQQLLSPVSTALSSADAWPALPLLEWEPTRATLHMWTQIVGKVRMALSPPLNHWWHVTLYVSPRGFTTSAIPYGAQQFDIEFDFLADQVVIRTSRGNIETVRLYPRSVADFYQEFMAKLKSAGVEVEISMAPQEVPNPIPFNQDREHASYDAEQARRFWRVLMSCDHVFKEFRGGFTGKCSPVHFFWGSFDLAVTRFSGRRAPPRPGADRMTREAYSHEEISLGWWPGGGAVKDAAFYAYAAPEPEGFKTRPIQPGSALYDQTLGEYLMMYGDVRKSGDPRAAVLAFAQSTYDSGAQLGKWDTALEVAHRPSAPAA